MGCAPAKAQQKNEKNQSENKIQNEINATTNDGKKESIKIIEDKFFDLQDPLIEQKREEIRRRYSDRSEARKSKCSQSQSGRNSFLLDFNNSSLMQKRKSRNSQLTADSNRTSKTFNNFDLGNQRMVYVENDYNQKQKSKKNSVDVNYLQIQNMNQSKERRKTELIPVPGVIAEEN